MTQDNYEAFINVAHEAAPPGYYHFKNKNGRKIEISEIEILQALNEQAEKDDSNITNNTNEDLFGWSVINATDEKGNNRPFCIMRSLPLTHHIPFHEVQEDDHEIAGILLEEIYSLTKRRIRWIRFKSKIKKFILGIFKK